MAPAQEFDDFGLPIRKFPSEETGEEAQSDSTGKSEDASKTAETKDIPNDTPKDASQKQEGGAKVFTKEGEIITGENSDKDVEPVPATPSPATISNEKSPEPNAKAGSDDGAATPVPTQTKENESLNKNTKDDAVTEPPVADSADTTRERSNTTSSTQAISGPSIQDVEAGKKAEEAKEEAKRSSQIGHNRDTSVASMSEFSHQQLTAEKEEKDDDDDDGWQEMPAYAPYDIYDDDNRLIAREHNDEEDEKYGYAGLGGAGKGYTRVLDDEDAESETSMDDNTRYLFNKTGASTSMVDDIDEQRDAVSQLQATKDLLTEGQRIAYVGVVRVQLHDMQTEAEFPFTKKTKKDVQTAAEAMRMWSQKIMIRLYAHMEISSAEQVMIEQLATHGVRPGDLTPLLMQNATVKNPMAEEQSSAPGTPKVGVRSPQASHPGTPRQEQSATAPPPYEAHAHDGEEMPEVKTPSQLPNSQKIDIDLRWTVLCDLFLVLIADSIYDARSRVLLERVAQALEVPWIDVCRFEKRVTDALEMQQAAEKENWNEEEHLENRRKLALKKRYVMMGLATVGGGLVIGLSAGLLAPLIGAGLAAGFTTIGVGGTSSFLAGAGGAAIITAGSTASGSFMGGKAAHRRTGAVKTFEYRPLHNNKRVNLIVTISGWMTSKVDDVRLPFSTVDALMGDIYSILWEPELLTSMGDTINILATEALTQGLQQVLGSTILISLMAALQLPVVLSKLAYLIDNPWAVSQDRAWAAGLILADSLIDRNLGTRPITLVGYSLGARVIFSCLLELARKGAYGLVQNVYMFGSPVVFKTEEYLKIRTVVAGRFVNGYHKNDWILGYLFRLTNGGIRRVAGLTSIEGIPGIENMDCTEFVKGHMDYRQAMPKLLRECGWLVESDEFGEIEDPDPEQHRERQRELISEIEEARRELEKEGEGKKKGAFAFFRKKKAQRADWEVYEDSKGHSDTNGSKSSDQTESNHGVLFDVDAMRAELAKEQANDANDGDELHVKELKSTLPPMKINVPPNENPRNGLREIKSDDATTTLRTAASPNLTVSQDRTPRLSSSGFGYHSPNPSQAYGLDHEDDGIEMTFDDGGFGGSSSAAPARPEIKSAQTTPNLAMHDPWADDDEDFGKEKEISMTFA
ncbi:hypothetical protein PFICI_00516 [Pestalotiopsis fici W106-1]|uniref:DUF726 domain protein n=1 Tax=Pestalotiopsis fici (strain W106-1 / CGMCC3.15140) TaxID=1229662 RepID=W3XKV2_PESFW|nr:uncharacterized protein PFICI_00516 [Pestalotiopsis fici W106-1]ETS86688.1 hypothetical protein PFICI_00516 [Pestalotiopsis fici W106-1]